jgi:hypothetical protein
MKRPQTQVETATAYLKYAKTKAIKDRNSGNFDFVWVDKKQGWENTILNESDFIAVEQITETTFSALQENGVKRLLMRLKTDNKEV